MHKGTSNSKWLVLLDQAIVSAANFTTTLIVGNYCGTESLGTYSVAFSIILIALALESSFVSTPLTVHFHEVPAKYRARKSAESLVNLMIVSLILVVAQLSVGLATGWLHPSEYTSLFFVVALTIPTFLARAFVRKYLLTIEKHFSLFVIDSLATVVQLLGLSIAVNSKSISPSLTLYLIASCNFLAVLLFLLQFRNKFEFGNLSIREKIKKDWKFGKWLAGEQVVSTLTVTGATWLIALQMSPGDVGIFMACFSITGLANPFILGFGNFLLPRLSRQFIENGSISGQVSKFAILNAVFMSFFCIVFGMFAEQILTYLYRNDDLIGQGAVLFVLAIRTAVSSTRLVYHTALVAIQKPRASVTASLIGLVLQLLTTFLLIPAFGIMGAAIAWTFSSSVEFTLARRGLANN